MKLTTVAVFGAGYLLGTRAGRERYEQLCELAHIAGGRFAGSGARRRLEEYGARLEAYAAQSRVAQSRVAQSRVAQSGRRSPAVGQPGGGRGPAARGGGGKRWPDPVVTRCGRPRAARSGPRRGSLQAAPAVQAPGGRGDPARWRPDARPGATWSSARSSWPGCSASGC